MTSAPQLTVVIVSTLGGRLLDETFKAIADQADGEVEIIVSAGYAAADRFEPGPTTATITLIRMTDRASIPELCGAGVRASRGAVVAVTSDHFVPAPDWITAIRRAHAEHPQIGVIGGAIESAATDNLIERAVYYCEYAQFGPAIPAEPCRAPVASASYTRSALAELASFLTVPTWEPFWHQHLLRRGVAIQRDPRVRVRHRCPRTLSGFLRERYQFSRSLAGERFASATPAVSLTRGLGSFLLPPLLLVRLLRRLRRSRDGGWKWATVPLLTLFTIPWAWGEVVGSLRGAGDTVRRIQ